MVRPAAQVASAAAEELVAGRRPLPTLELTKIFEFQIVEFDEFA